MPIGDFGQIVNIHKTLAECMKTWKSNLEETRTALFGLVES